MFSAADGGERVAEQPSDSAAQAKLAGTLSLSWLCPARAGSGGGREDGLL